MSGIPIDEWTSKAVTRGAVEEAVDGSYLAPPQSNPEPFGRPINRMPPVVNADQDAFNAYLDIQKSGHPVFEGIPEGHVRMFRGDTPGEQGVLGEEHYAGRWFTPDPDYAEIYGDVKYVDVLEEQARASHARTVGFTRFGENEFKKNGVVENVLPQEIADEARPLGADVHRRPVDWRASANPSRASVTVDEIAEGVLRDNATYKSNIEKISTPIPEPLRARAEAAMDAARNPRPITGTGDPFVRLDEINANPPGRPVKPRSTPRPKPPVEKSVDEVVEKAQRKGHKVADDVSELVKKTRKSAPKAGDDAAELLGKHRGKVAIAGAVVGGALALKHFVSKKREEPKAAAAVTGDFGNAASPAPPIPITATMGDQNRDRRQMQLMNARQRAGSFLNTGTSSARNGLAVRTSQF